MKLPIRAVMLCSLLGLTNSLLTGVTLAATPAGPPQRIVNFADLDVAHAPGAAALYSRIKHAAREVCQSDTRDLGALRRAGRCQVQAIAEAVTRINLAELTKYVANTNWTVLMARQP
jgi:UrcA family protein